MKKLILGMVIGAVATLLIQQAWVQWQFYQWKQSQERHLPFIVENIINRDLRGARFLDMSWSKSTKSVNYAHDKLYDAHVTYERNGQIKSFTIQLGTSGKGWISPPASELEILDDKAEIIHTKKGNVEHL
jgi:hypothetical protein